MNSKYSANFVFFRDNTSSISVGETELLCEVFLACLEETLKCIKILKLLKCIKNHTLWTCQKVCEALTFLLDNIYIRFGTKLFRQIVGIPMGTNCAPLVADLFLFCYERDFMMSLSIETDLKSLKLLARPRFG